MNLLPGIVDTDPLTVRCGHRGAIAYRTTERHDATFMILCGYRFHGCEPDVRLCPECLKVALAECPKEACRG